MFEIFYFLVEDQKSPYLSWFSSFTILCLRIYYRIIIGVKYLEALNNLSGFWNIYTHIIMCTNYKPLMEERFSLSTQVSCFTAPPGAVAHFLNSG